MEINASTTHKMAKKPAGKAKATTVGIGKAKPVGGGKGGGGAAKTAASSKQRGWAPTLKPASYTPDSVLLREYQQSSSVQQQKDAVQNLFHTVLGETTGGPQSTLSTPHAKSTTQDRAGAAADLAVLAKLGNANNKRGAGASLRFVLKDCGLYEEMQKLLFPAGIEAVLKTSHNDDDKSNNNDEEELNVGLKPSRSAVSLTSLDDATTVTSFGDNLTNDSKTRGKTTPANAREGCLLLIRALCEGVGSPHVEPYVVGAFLAVALDECASGNGAIRQAASDTSMAIVYVANPWAFSSILRPLLLQTLAHSTEWRVKAAALECLQHCAATKPAVVQTLIPKLLPPLVSQVWDTKPQVSKAARSALLAICQTNTNPDIEKTIPAVVNAICKPSDTNKAISELMGTTFVVPVDASTLAILCPVLARGLKEKLAIHKRAACLVISNMSKLVERPQAVAPFGSLLVPELQKVCQNVQFQEIRDEALKALANLTKALGELYKSYAEDDAANNAESADPSALASEMEEKQQSVQAEQERVQREKDEAAAREEELKRKEEEERQRFKEAMNAQRELEKIEAQKAVERKKEEEKKKEKAKLSTKGATGKCQACGLKKCKKSCVFYSGK